MTQTRKIALLIAAAILSGSHLQASVLSYQATGRPGSIGTQFAGCSRVGPASSEGEGVIAGYAFRGISVFTPESTGFVGFIRDAINGTVFTDLTGDFLDTRYHSHPNSLVASANPRTPLTEASTPTSPGTFGSSIIAAYEDVLRQSPAASVDLASALDSSRPSSNGASLSVEITPVPELATLFPLVGLFVAVSSTHILRRRKMQRLLISSVGG